MGLFKNYSSRISYLKTISDYHYDTTLNDSNSFKVIGRFQPANWMSEIEQLLDRKIPYGLENLVENSTVRGRRNLQFDVSLNGDPSYEQNHICYYTFQNSDFNRETAPTIFKMVDWFQMEPSSVIPRIHIQYPGQVFPYHVDALTKNSTAEVGPENMRHQPGQWARVQVQLQDWIWGHMWSIGNSYWTQWRAGEIMYHPWWTMPHGTANCGYSPRFSLQITGRVTQQTDEILRAQNLSIDLTKL